LSVFPLTPGRPAARLRAWLAARAVRVTVVAIPGTTFPGSPPLERRTARDRILYR